MAKRSVSDFLKETRRRRVFRLAALYIVGAWVFLQVAALAFPAFNIPETAIRYVWIGVLIAFPIVLVFGWRYDIVDSQIVRTLRADENVELSLQRSDYIILSSLVAVFIAIAISLVIEISDTQFPDANTDWTEDADPASIAVLPFLNMSPDPDNSYIADGISEEILNGLAKVAGLRVSARTSAFSLRDKKLSARQIGKLLKVAFILEGSIRVAGEKLRITAQLVDCRDDVHRWSETYDQSMSDIFKVQNTIAQNVVFQMKSVLGVETSATEPVASTENAEAYSKYLRARTLLRNRNFLDFDNLLEAIEHLELAVELDAQFSDGFVALADAYHALAQAHYHSYQPAEAEEAAMRAEAASSTALKIAPSSSEALRAWGTIVAEGDEAEKHLRMSIAANPNNAAPYKALAFIGIEKGDIEEGLALARKYHLLDPLNADSSLLLAQALVVDDQLKEASIYFRNGAQIVSDQLGEDAQPSQEYLGQIAKLSSKHKPLTDDFETHLRMGLQGECSDDFRLSISDEAYTGNQSAHFYSSPNAKGWCNTGAGAPAEPYRDKYIRLVGMVKTKNATDGAALWMRIDGWKFAFMLGFDNGAPDYVDDPNTDWRPYELSLYVPSDAYVILYGGVLSGPGELWMDDFRFEVSDSPDFKKR